VNSGALGGYTVPAPLAASIIILWTLLRHFRFLTWLQWYLKNWMSANHLFSYINFLKGAFMNMYLL
jgi:hypothetical protein